MKAINKKRAISLLSVVAVATSAAGASLITETVNGNVPVAVAEVLAATPQMSQSGNTYYVSPDADEKMNASQVVGSQEEPANIYNIFELGIIKGGDTVILLPGTYNLSKGIKIENYGGEYNNYITVKNASDTQKVVLDFSAQTFDSTNRGVQIYTDYWYWYGIDICGAGDNGMYIAGDYNIIENCEFYNNRDSGLQLGRAYSDYANIKDWPNYNLIKNCTSYNNYDNETYGENADGFAAKLTVGYGNVFDGCIAYRNSDDGWDLYAKTDSGNIGAVYMYNCIAFENGFLMETQKTCNDRFPTFDSEKYGEAGEKGQNSFNTRDGDGNGFKLGGSVMEGESFLYNCLAFNNKMHGITDNSNPGVIYVENCTSYNNSAVVDDDSTSQTFGQIVNVEQAAGYEKCNNIDLARSESSYNVIKNTLSVNNGSLTTGIDQFRGSAEYTYLSASSSSANKIESNIDASTYVSTKIGTSVTAPSADDIFVAYPTANLGISYNVHEKYRNSDGSVNFGDILKIKDQSKLFGSVRTIGADLSKNDYTEYSHYDYVYLNSCVSETDAQLTAVEKMIYVPCDLNACYQDFDVVTSMAGITINWSSSNESVLKVTGKTGTSYSGHTDVRVEVYRSEDKDEVVTLTATVTKDNVTKVKEYEITVKRNVPEIGNVVVAGVENGSVIVDQYSLFSEPVVSVENGADYNGKLLSESVYDIQTTYMYAPDKNSKFNQVKGFTTSNAGIFEITHKVNLKSDNKNYVEYTYSIYVASSSATVDFVDKQASLIVNKNGFVITGNLTNVTGSVNALTKAPTAEAPTAQQIVAEGQPYSFRSDSVRAEFTADNSQAYTVYYVVCNANGEPTSQIYNVPVTVVDISNKADFEAMLASNSSDTIYRLVNDINVNGEIAYSKTSFNGLFNGMGHTISNATVKGTGIFYKVENGTIMNVKFDNVSIDSTEEKTGIIGQIYGGFVYNVAINNISIYSTTNRVGGLIGQVITDKEGDQRVTYIDQVSVTNDDEHVIHGSQRVGGIIGYIQAGDALSANKVYISNCFVNTLIEGTDYNGGIVGRSDDRNAEDRLEISYCYFAGTIKCAQRVGGMIGGFTGVGVTRITNCVTLGELYYANDMINEVVTAQKNCSGMVGNYAANADMIVKNCYAKFEDHNSAYDVSTMVILMQDTELFWGTYVKFDLTNLWTFNAEEAPYVTLNFIA